MVYPDLDATAPPLDQLVALLTRWRQQAQGKEEEEEEDFKKAEGTEEGATVALQASVTTSKNGCSDWPSAIVYVSTRAAADDVAARWVRGREGGGDAAAASAAAAALGRSTPMRSLVSSALLSLAASLECYETYSTAVSVLCVSCSALFRLVSRVRALLREISTSSFRARCAQLTV